MVNDNFLDPDEYEEVLAQFSDNLLDKDESACLICPLKNCLKVGCPLFTHQYDKYSPPFDAILASA